MAARSAQILPDVVDRELRTRYRQLPVMLRTAGLSATYAFIAAKSRDSSALGQAYARVADGIVTHLSERKLIAAGPGRPGHRQVLTLLAAMDLADYTQASTEVAELAQWLARLADAVSRDRADGAGDGADG
jgi:CRISPR type III-B/RAMP module-associated protein Cmr5